MSHRPPSSANNPPLPPPSNPSSSGTRPPPAGSNVWTSGAARRGLPLLSTASRPDSGGDSTLSPTGTASTAHQHPSVAATRQVTSRQSSTSSTASLVSPPASAHVGGGSRSRAVTSTGSPRLTSLASPSRSGSAAGSARLAKHSPSLSQSTLGSPTHTPLTSLVATQLNILLSTLKLNNYDTQAEKIRHLVDDNGGSMDVFTTFFRRLLQSNAPAIFPASARPASTAGGADTAGQYKLLSEEMAKIARDPQQAERIAQSLDTNEGELFRDFDLATFVEHFRLSAVAKVALVLPMRSCSKADLRSKADAILSTSLQPFLTSLIHPSQQPSDPQSEDVWPAALAILIERLILEPPRNWGEEQQENLQYAIKVRYSKLGARIPPPIESALYMMALLDSSDGRLARIVQRAGPKGTASLDACKEMLGQAEPRDISYPQIANALLFMVSAQSGDPYDAGVFVEGVRQHRAGPRIDWTDVVQGFDREGVRITKPQFLALYHALSPLAREYANFDIQNLWSGQWQFPETQLSFVVAFLLTTPQELDVTRIPNLRQAFTLADFSNASDSIKAFAAEAVNHPLVSRDATEALFTMIFRSQDTYNHAQMLGIPELIINPNMTIFVCAASAVPKPWAPLQEQALKQLFYPFLNKQHANYDFVMHSLWMHDRQWVANRLVEFYDQRPMLLERISEHAQEQGFLDLLLTIPSKFAVDLATYAHGRGECNLQEWAQPHIQDMGQAAFARAMQEFLGTKLEDESAVQQGEAEPSTPRLAVKTVHLLLLLIGDYLPDHETGPCYRQCLQRYARLFNYGEDAKIDAILDSKGEEGNALPDEAGSKMEEQYKDMYGGKTNPEQLVSELKRLKTSEDPDDQDLFAAMLQGLFDEYNCFGEYPNEALATTAVLFGGLLQFHVLSSVAEHAAIFMIFQAVGEYGPADPMYRFGLQAMIHLTGRLEEWPHVAERILHTPNLRNTQVIPLAEEAVKKAQQDTVGMNGDVLNGITNGLSADEGLLAESPTPSFTCINVDRPTREAIYEDPDEDTSDKVMFVLNNVSKRNFDEKFKDLADALEEKHHQWFAHYLVEELAKTQANFQGLYMQLLSTFGLRTLWQEVRRQTYISAAKMLNAESTMNSAPERVNLKNMATWLGSLTLARNQPILHRNLSFKDLLIEGHDTQRLLVAIPFTCKTLAHAKNSIFQPPNPWIMELLGVLSELYSCFDLKLNLKFEIEMLCKELGTNIKDIEPLDVIRTGKPILQQESLVPFMPETGGQDGFGDMHLMGLAKRPPNERFSPENVIQALPDLSGMLQIPQAAGNVTQPQMRNIFVSAAQQAIYEIIAPVVERSVTIAAISTSELIQKDFATEVDVEKMLSSAHTMVKKLSGCLALVTCKEPLRMSIMNNIRILAARGLPDQLPEGQIIMFVNDNIETVCGLVEQQAAEHSMAEINAQLAQALEDRRRHVAERSDEPYNQPPVTRWAQLIAPPFAQQPNGLNSQQLALYEDFGRQARVTAPATQHISEQSIDRTQLPDVLQENYIPSMTTPAETPALPRQTPQQRQLQSLQGQQVNGYAETPQLAQQIGETLRDLQQTSREASEMHVSEISQDSPVRRIFARLLALVDSAGMHKDDMCTSVGMQCLAAVITDGAKRLEIEVFVSVMRSLYTMSAPTARVMSMQLAALDDLKMCNPPLIIALMQEKLIDKQYVDHAASRLVRAHTVAVLGFLEEFFDEALSSEKVMAFHSDYVLIYDSLRAWLDYGIESLNAPEEEQEERDVVPPEVVDRLQQLMSRLQQRPAGQQANGLPSPPIDEKQDRLDYVFEEWITLQRKDTPVHCYTAFIKQVHEQHLLSHPEDNIAFWRRCIEAALAFFEKEVITPYATPDSPYLKIDAAAKLMAYLVACQPPQALEASRAKSLDSIVRLVILIMNDHQNKQRGERFNARFYFRLFSTLICETHALNRMNPQQGFVMSQVFYIALQALQPRYFPTFLYSWLALLSHRLFVPAFLAGEGRVNGGWQGYLKLLSLLTENLGKMLAVAEVSPVTQDFYRGVARIFMMLHHDFPEFLIENHLQLNTYIPLNCHQLCNIVNSAVPRGMMTSQPDPFQAGLKINRLEQVRAAPTVFADLDRILESFGVKEVMQRACTGSGADLASDEVHVVVSVVDGAKGQHLRLLLNTLVLYVGVHATRTSSSFSSPAPPARLLEATFRDLAGSEARYQLASAMVNQLRYVNAHMHYFATALQHYFLTGSEEVQETILRVLVERLGVPRPHPWGVIVMTLELVKNSGAGADGNGAGGRGVFEMEWVKAAPQVESMLRSLVASQERGGR